MLYCIRFVCFIYSICSLLYVWGSTDTTGRGIIQNFEQKSWGRHIYTCLNCTLQFKVIGKSFFHADLFFWMTHEALYLPGFNPRSRHTKDFQKRYLIPPCLTLGNISYISRVKWSNPGKGVAPSSTPRWSILILIVILMKVLSFLNNGYFRYFENIIIIMMSCCLHGFPWLSLAIRPYHPSLLSSPQRYILYPYRGVVDKCLMVVQHLQVRVKGSIEKRR